MIHHRVEHELEASDIAKQREPIALSPAYLAAIRELAALRCNRAGADKTWVYRLVEDSRRYFERVKRT